MPRRAATRWNFTLIGSLTHMYHITLSAPGATSRDLKEGVFGLVLYHQFQLTGPCLRAHLSATVIESAWLRLPEYVCSAALSYFIEYLGVLGRQGIFCDTYLCLI